MSTQLAQHNSRKAFEVQSIRTSQALIEDENQQLGKEIVRDRQLTQDMDQYNRDHFAANHAHVRKVGTEISKIQDNEREAAAAWKIEQREKDIIAALERERHTATTDVRINERKEATKALEHQLGIGRTQGIMSRKYKFNALLRIESHLT
jgi:hypothetical protein